MQEIQGNMDDVLSRNDLPEDEKDKRYFQLQNRYLAYKEQLRASLCKIPISSFAHKIDFAHNFSVDFF